MDYRKKGKIFESFMSGNSGDRLDDIIRGWMSVCKDDPEIESLFREYFDMKVRQRKPTRKTYRKLQEIEQRLGFERAAIIHIPLTKRLGFRVAAVLIPVLILVGTVLRNDRVPQYPYVPVVVVEERMPEMEMIKDRSPEPVVTESKPQPESRYLEPVADVPRYDLNYHADGRSERFVTLPDNSTVLLRNGSRLAYSTARREAFLEGDAFFIIAKNGTVPFKAASANIRVEVMGTEFGMTVWPGDDRDRVALAAGSVNVKTKENKSVRMRPLQEFAYSPKTHRIELAPWDGQGWWIGFISFENGTMYEILSELGAYYDMEISGTEIMDDTGYTIKFDKRSTLDNALSGLAACAPQYRFERSGSKIIVKKN